MERWRLTGVSSAVFVRGLTWLDERLRRADRLPERQAALGGGVTPRGWGGLTLGGRPAYGPMSPVAPGLPGLRRATFDPA